MPAITASPTLSAQSVSDHLDSIGSIGLLSEDEIEVPSKDELERDMIEFRRGRALLMRNRPVSLGARLQRRCSVWLGTTFAYNTHRIAVDEFGAGLFIGACIGFVASISASYIMLELLLAARALPPQPQQTNTSLPSAAASGLAAFARETWSASRATSQALPTLSPSLKHL